MQSGEKRWRPLEAKGSWQEHHGQSNFHRRTSRDLGDKWHGASRSSGYSRWQHDYHDDRESCRDFSSSYHHDTQHSHYRRSRTPPRSHDHWKHESRNYRSRSRSRSRSRIRSFSRSDSSCSESRSEQRNDSKKDSHFNSLSPACSLSSSISRSESLVHDEQVDCARVPSSSSAPMKESQPMSNESLHRISVVPTRSSSVTDLSQKLKDKSNGASPSHSVSIGISEGMLNHVKKESNADTAPLTSVSETKANVSEPVAKGDEADGLTFFPQLPSAEILRSALDTLEFEQSKAKEEEASLVKEYDELVMKIRSGCDSAPSEQAGDTLDKEKAKEEETLEKRKDEIACLEKELERTSVELEQTNAMLGKIDADFVDVYAATRCEAEEQMITDVYARGLETAEQNQVVPEFPEFVPIIKQRREEFLNRVLLKALCDPHSSQLLDSGAGGSRDDDAIMPPAPVSDHLDDEQAVVPPMEENDDDEIDARSEKGGSAANNSGANRSRKIPLLEDLYTIPFDKERLFRYINTLPEPSAALVSRIRDYAERTNASREKRAVAQAKEYLNLERVWRLQLRNRERMQFNARKERLIKLKPALTKGYFRRIADKYPCCNELLDAEQQESDEDASVPKPELEVVTIFGEPGTRVLRSSKGVTKTSLPATMSPDTLSAVSLEYAQDAPSSSPGRAEWQQQSAVHRVAFVPTTPRKRGKSQQESGALFVQPPPTLFGEEEDAVSRGVPYDQFAEREAEIDERETKRYAPFQAPVPPLTQFAPLLDHPDASLKSGAVATDYSFGLNVYDFAASSREVAPTDGAPVYGIGTSYRNRVCGRLLNPRLLMRQIAQHREWTPEQVEQFRVLFEKYPRKFALIAGMMQKSHESVVDFFYANKFKLDLHKRKRKRVLAHASHIDEEGTHWGSDADVKKEKVATDSWSDQEKMRFLKLIQKFGRDFEGISDHIGTKTARQCKNFFQNNKKKFHLERYAKSHQKRKGRPKRQESDALSTPEQLPQE